VPILMVPEPLLNQDVTEDEDEWGDVWTGPHVPFLSATFRELVHDGLAPYSVAVLDQPSETVAEGAFTHPKYGMGAANFFGKSRAWERRKDRRHMNEEYGRLICQKIATWLKSQG
jgi:hypothetical protein